MIEKTFVDTNILVYAHDLEAAVKREIAQKILADLWENETGIISIQVLHEFYVAITRKIQKPLSISTAKGIIENYMAWPLVINDEKTMMRATEIEDRYRLSFWASAKNLLFARSFQTLNEAMCWFVILE